jgi:hypothetical protein
MKTYTIMILNDGSTYTSVDGCEIVTISEAGHDILCEGGEPKDIPDSEILLSIEMNSEEK